VVLVTRTVKGQVRDRVVVVWGLKVDEGSLLEVKGGVYEFLHDQLELIV
jgi:hypothetical protein